MKYYKVGENLDQRSIYKFVGHKKRMVCSIVLFKDELFTLRELKHYGIDPEKLQIVDVPKNKTYWIFGSRREICD